MDEKKDLQEVELKQTRELQETELEKRRDLQAQELAKITEQENTYKKRIREHLPLLLVSVILSFFFAYYYIDKVIFGDTFIMGNSILERLHPAIFTVLFVGVVEGFATAFEKERKREALYFMILLLLMSISILLYGDRYMPLSPLALLMWHGLAIYYVVVRMDLLAAGKSSGLAFFDVLTGTIILPFGNYILRVRTIFEAFKAYTEKRRERLSVEGGEEQYQVSRKRVGVILASAFAAVLIGAFAWSQLAGADSDFANIGNTIRSWFSGWKLELEEETWLELLMSLPVGAYLTGLVAGGAITVKPALTAAYFDDLMRPYRRLPKISISIVTGVLLVIYLLFFYLQARGFLPILLSGEILTAPEAATFAITGFWELMRILVLNFLLTFFILYFAPKEVSAHQAVKLLLMFLGIASLFFVFLDASKLYLYIHLYGFTGRRLVAAWVLVTAGLSAVLVLARTQKEFPCIRYLIWLFAGSFVLYAMLPTEMLLV